VLRETSRAMTGGARLRYFDGPWTFSLFFDQATAAHRQGDLAAAEQALSAPCCPLNRKNPQLPPSPRCIAGPQQGPRG